MTFQDSRLSPAVGGKLVSPWLKALRAQARIEGEAMCQLGSTLLETGSYERKKKSSLEEKGEKEEEEEQKKNEKIM